MGVRDPRADGLSREAQSAIALAERLGLRDIHVFFNDWTPYDTRQNVYLDATAAVSFHRAHLETRFSFRTRILDCIWASLPIVSSAGDVLADLVRNEELGITVAPGDVDAAASAIVRVASDDALRRAARENLDGTRAPAYLEYGSRAAGRVAREADTQRCCDGSRWVRAR